MLNAKEVPDVLWRYMGIIDFMNENPGMYHMDAIREKVHNEVAEHFGIPREAVSNALEDSKDAVDMYLKLKS